MIFRKLSPRLQTVGWLEVDTESLCVSRHVQQHSLPMTSHPAYYLSVLYETQPRRHCVIRLPQRTTQCNFVPSFVCHAEMAIL